MNVLFEISKEQQIDLLNNWLDADDITCLDSAICSHKLRQEFLDLLAAPECHLLQQDFQDEHTVAWVVKRKVKFQKVHLSYYAVRNHFLREKFFETIGSHVRTLYVDFEPVNNDDLPSLSTDIMVCEISAYCSVLEDLTLSYTTVNGALAFPLYNCKQLTSLSLSMCDNIPASVLQAVCSSPRLRYVCICNSSTFAADAFSFAAKGCPTCTTLHLSDVKLTTPQLLHLMQYLPNITQLEVSVESCADIVLLASLCTRVLSAYITTDVPLLPTEAASIATCWTSIENLSILLPKTARDEADMAVCDEMCVFAFVDQCLKLRHLILAHDHMNRIADRSLPGTCSSNIAVSSGNVTQNVSNVLGVRSNTASSPLLTLSAPSLSYKGLLRLTAACPHLHTLHIYHPPGHVRVASDAQFHLRYLNNSSIKALLLTSVNLKDEHLLQLQTIEKLVVCRLKKPITTKGIVKLVKQCPSLRSLCIHACTGVDPSVILQVLNAGPSIVSFQYYTLYERSYFAAIPSVKVLKEVVTSCFPRLEVFDVRC